MMHRPRRTTWTLSCAALVACVGVAGCGGSSAPDQAGLVDRARECLGKTTLRLEPASQADDDVAESVAATSFDADADPPVFVLAVAARTTSDAAVERFTRETTAFAREAERSSDVEIEVESGTEGRYVWVVAASATTDAVTQARECVEPS